MQTTILQGSEFSPLLEAGQGQFTAFSCYEKESWNWGLPTPSLGSSCWAETLSPGLNCTGALLPPHQCLGMPPLDPDLRFNISAWSQAFLITTGLLWPRASAKPGWGHQSVPLALLRCGGTGSLCCASPVPILSCPGSRQPLPSPGRFFWVIFHSDFYFCWNSSWLLPCER